MSYLCDENVYKWLKYDIFIGGVDLFLLICFIVDFLNNVIWNISCFKGDS